MIKDKKIIKGSFLFALAGIMLVPVTASAATLPSVDAGLYYGDSSSLFLENYPAENYNFSDNTASVKGILTEDTELGYLNYPVNLNHNTVVNSDDTIYFFSGSEKVSISTEEFDAMVGDLSEDTKTKIASLVSDIESSVGTLPSSSGGVASSSTSSTTSSSDGTGWLTMGDVFSNVKDTWGF